MAKSKSDHERQKWDQYYQSLQPEAESDEIFAFRDQFVEAIQTLLPEGGGVLEAGCGAGMQSLALARRGFDVTLLDFSEQALNQARRRFAHHGLEATFLLQDAFDHGQPEFDLVFNAGVLEHYSYDQQVDFLRAMASRSKKYVLALVPNRHNYWYWIWRTHKIGQNLWPFGKEIPTATLEDTFDAAGLHTLGDAYFGATWTETFIAGLDGLSDELKSLVLDIHRSGLLPSRQTDYLVATLGSVEPTPQPDGWHSFDQPDSPAAETLAAALADTLALGVSTSRDAQQLQDEIVSKLADVLNRVQNLEQRDTVALWQQHLQAWEQKSRNEFQAQVEAIDQRRDRQMGVLIEQVRQIEREHTAAQVQKDQQVQSLQAQVAALSQPPPTFRDRLRAMWHRILVTLRQHPRLAWPRRVYKRIRHFARKEAAKTEASPEHVFEAPVSLGHPAIPPDRRVIILTYTFFDFDGNTLYRGGAERYVLQLADLIRRLGHHPEVVQCGNGFWVRYFQDLRVTGLDVGGEAANLPAVFQQLDAQTALIIYSPFSLAQAPTGTPSIGISHGVYWDHLSFQVDPAPRQEILRACQHVDALVSVDTNTINWLRATSAPLAEKLTYLPNFVDLNRFKPGQRSDEHLIVLYPRRLYRPRGFWLVAEILPHILERYPQVVFRFFGQAEPPEEDKIAQLQSHYPGRVTWTSLPHERMPDAYADADITLIPTVHSEGTSLSCLEALASGSAVVATHVGGLPDLILDEHNGLLIEPTVDALSQALERLIDDENLRERLGRNGRQVAASFSLERWRAHWQEILTQLLPDPLDEPFSRLPVAVFPAAPGIPWQGIKQRPHHLARQLAQAGIETFWRNPNGRRPSLDPLLHVMAAGDRFLARRPIVLIYYPFHYRDLDQYDQPFVIYDILDDISIHAASDRELGLPEGERAVDNHQKLLAEADLVIVSSSVLHQRIREQRPDAILIPNGVDLSHFQQPAASESESRPSSAKQSVIGFHGAIAEWFDLDLFCQVVALRSDYHFVLIGPASVSLDRLKQYSNVHYRGMVDYEDIPAEIADFDVGILPFILSPLTHGVRPLKGLEYLAMGKPVVSTPLQTMKYWPAVFTAETPEAFVEQIDTALAAKDTIAEDEQVHSFVAASSWQSTTTPLIERIKNLNAESGRCRDTAGKF
jgi:glycosyltransferase involved in cell wall biosynthesis/SAM-dependent methyltransferase